MHDAIGVFILVLCPFVCIAIFVYLGITLNREEDIRQKALDNLKESLKDLLEYIKENNKGAK